MRTFECAHLNAHIVRHQAIILILRLIGWQFAWYTWPLKAPGKAERYSSANFSYWGDMQVKSQVVTIGAGTLMAMSLIACGSTATQVVAVQKGAVPLDQVHIGVPTTVFK